MSLRGSWYGTELPEETLAVAEATGMTPEERGD